MKRFKVFQNICSSKNSESRWKINAKRERERERYEWAVNRQWGARRVHSRHGRGNDKLWITRATRVADVYPRHVNMCIGVVPRKCAQKYAYTWFRPADPVADDLHAVAQRQLASHRTTTFPPQTLSILAVVHCPDFAHRLTLRNLLVRAIFRREFVVSVDWISNAWKKNRWQDGLKWFEVVRSGLKWFKDGEKRLNVCRGVNHKTEWIFKDEICDRGVILFNVDCFKRDRNFVGFFFFIVIIEIFALAIS